MGLLVPTTLVKNDKGQHIQDLQLKLQALGYHLPRWGADSDLGDETLSAVEAFKRDRRIGRSSDDLPDTVPDKVVRAIGAAYDVLSAANGSHPVLVDISNAHGGSQRIRRRAWTEITGITLHQTAVLLGEKRERWHNIPVQIGVTRQGQILIINGIEWLCYHANSLNGPDIGIEIDGYFEGIEGKINTFWRPPEEPNRVPLQPSAVQLEAARQAVRWICDEVARNGGKIKFIHAHRQASNQRQSDPGSRIWKEVGLWAQRTLGLSDGGARFTVGSGLPIPQAWDSSRTGISY